MAKPSSTFFSTSRQSSSNPFSSDPLRASNKMGIVQTVKSGMFDFFKRKKKAPEEQKPAVRPPPPPRRQLRLHRRRPRRPPRPLPPPPRQPRRRPPPRRRPLRPPRRADGSRRHKQVTAPATFTSSRPPTMDRPVSPSTRHSSMRTMALPGSPTKAAVRSSPAWTPADDASTSW